jgi:hypothetical protein
MNFNNKDKIMKRWYYIFLIVIFGLLGSAGSDLREPNEFEPLFNGVDLNSWVNVNGAPETWIVKDQMIVCSGIPTGVLRTEKQYENFILELEWRHTEQGGNAGLFIHSGDLPVRGKPFTRAIECQIMDGNHGDVFAIQGATLTPDDSSPEKKWMRSFPKQKVAKPAGEWNHYRVESRDGMVSLAVNGKEVTHAYHLNPRKGYICLESEGSEVHFRNIRIRELPSGDSPPEVTGSPDQGFRSLYNGLDLRGWKVPEGGIGHWQARDWILEYDGQSTAEGEEKHLWTEEEFSDFILIVDWRQPANPVPEQVPIILPSGAQAADADGNRVTTEVADAGDSGIYLRGTSKCQINIWNWPVGSGEIWGYRTDEEMPNEVRSSATPLFKADMPPGEWNRFIITVEKERISVELNGKTVIREAKLPGLPEKGPIALQHHGDSIQFANIYIKEL